jgi:hypothetical protein
MSLLCFVEIEREFIPTSSLIRILINNKKILIVVLLLGINGLGIIIVTSTFLTDYDLVCIWQSWWQIYTND